MKAKLIKLALHDGYRLDDENGLLIASTHYSSKNKLSLKNCQAIERGYDLDELATAYFMQEWAWIKSSTEPYSNETVEQVKKDFVSGFQKALELMGDKKFSEDDIYEAFSLGERGDRFELGDLLDSRQKTEWDVEVEMEETGIQLSPDATSIQDSSYAVVTRKPKLDADGCLILRLIIE